MQRLLSNIKRLPAHKLKISSMQIVSAHPPIHCCMLYQLLPGLTILPWQEQEGSARTIVGSLTAELLRLSDPLRTQYRAQHAAWHDAEGNETLGVPLMRQLVTTMGPITLAALDRILAHRSAQVCVTHLTHATWAAVMCNIHVHCSCTVFNVQTPVSRPLGMA